MSITLKNIFKKLFILPLVFFSNFFKLSDFELCGNLTSFTKFKFLVVPIFDLSFINGRTIRGLKYDMGLDPFINAFNILNSFSSKNDATDYLAKNIAINSNFKIKDLHQFSSGFKFSNFPIYAMVYPWDYYDFSYLKDNYEINFRKNRNLIKDYNVTLESPTFLISLSHIEQFQILTDLILKNGYRENYYDLPVVFILIKGNKWCWINSNAGNHRSIIKFGLGYNDIKANICKVIDYDDLKNLVNVKNFNYSVKDAQFIFDKVFIGLEPSRGNL